jgi:hypothetical protein
MRVQYQALCLFGLSIAAFSAVFPGCDKDEPTSSTPPSTSAIAAALGIDASELAAPLVDPPRPAGDLRADVAKFTTVEACMKDHGRLDPVVGDALDHVGYDTLVRDACIVLGAAKQKDAKKCDGIDSSALRSRCRSVLAMLAADPDACPLRFEGKAELGRDGTCVAAAARTPALCTGEDVRLRPFCDALVLRDAKRCAVLTLEEDRVRCTRDSERMASSFEGGTPLLAQPLDGKGTLEIHGEGGAPDPAEGKIDLGFDVGSGVVLVTTHKEARLRIGSTDAALTVRATGPNTRTRFGVLLGVLGDQIEVRELSLAVPGASSMSCPGVKCNVKVKSTAKLEPKRGAAVTLDLEGTVGTAPNAFRIHAQVNTFVRDVVDESTLTR